MSNGRVALEKVLEFLTNLNESDLLYLGKLDQVDNLIDIIEDALEYLDDGVAPNGREWKNLTRSDTKDMLKSAEDRVLVRAVQNILREKNT